MSWVKISARRLAVLFSWFSSVPPGKCWDSTFKLGSVPHPFQFTCHPFISHYIVWVTEEASFSKLYKAIPTTNVKTDGRLLHIALQWRTVAQSCDLHMIQDGRVHWDICIEQQARIWMYSAEILCTLSFMACVNILYKRMNTVFWY
jgi:hypothetical protein